MLSDSEYQAIVAEAKAETASQAAVPEEVPAEEVIEEVAESAETAEEAAAEEDDAETPADESETTDESADEEAEPTFSLDPIPSSDELNKFPRTNPEARAKLVELAAGWRADRALVDSIGGETVISVVKPLTDLLTKASSTPEERVPALATLVSSNPTVGMEIAEDFTRLVFGDPVAKAYGDKVSQELFGTDLLSMYGLAQLKADYGDKANPEHIKEFLKLEAAGIIDTTDGMNLFNSEFGGSELFEKQRQDNADLQRQLDEIKQNPAKFLTQPEIVSTKATEDFDKALMDRFEDGVKPIRETHRWKADSRVAKLANRAIIAELKEEPEYKEAMKQLSQSGQFIPGNMVTTLAMNRLVEKARGRYAEEVRGINSDLKGLTETSRNAQLQKRTETKPKAAPLITREQEVHKVRRNDEIDNLWDEFAKAGSDRALHAQRSA